MQYKLRQELVGNQAEKFINHKNKDLNVDEGKYAKVKIGMIEKLVG